MCTLEFREGIEELISLEKQQEVKKKRYDDNNSNNIAIMCAEALPWRCHRRLVSDYFLAMKNVEVCDIMNIYHKSLHNLTSFACIENEILTYPSKINN